MKQVHMFLVILCIWDGIWVHGLPTIPHPLESNQNVYVLSALEHHEAVPANAIEIQPDEHKHKDIPEDHILKKKLVVMPLSDVSNDTKVLTNEHGHAILAHGVDTSNEDMDTAESIVFQPLFSYRRKQASRRRYYIPQRTYNYRGQNQIRNQNYVPCGNNRRQYDYNGRAQAYRPTRSFSNNYPSWYQNAQFPALI